jgi:hypothetical protein
MHWFPGACQSDQGTVQENSKYCTAWHFKGYLVTLFRLLGLLVILLIIRFMLIDVLVVFDTQKFRTKLADKLVILHCAIFQMYIKNVFQLLSNGHM